MEQERTYKWIQDRLRDLHSGTLSESDRARLFELSKDDPFLKDALEGYQSAPWHDHVARLQTISHRIQSKTFAKRRKLFPSRQQWVMQAVAASLLLILVTWAVIYYVGKENNAVFVSSETTDANATDSIFENTDVKHDVDSDLAYEEQPATELLQEEPGLRANARSKYEAASKESESIYTAPSSSGVNPGTIAAAEEPPPPTIDAIESKDISRKSTNVQSDEVVSEIAIEQTDSDDRSLMDAGSTANAMSPAMLEQRVTGQIMNSFGQPLTGAFISIPNSNLITTSDTYGQFELFIPEYNLRLKYHLQDIRIQLCSCKKDRKMSW